MVNVAERLAGQKLPDIQGLVTRDNIDRSGTSVGGYSLVDTPLHNIKKKIELGLRPVEQAPSSFAIEFQKEVNNQLEKQAVLERHKIEQQERRRVEETKRNEQSRGGFFSSIATAARSVFGGLFGNPKKVAITASAGAVAVAAVGLGVYAFEKGSFGEERQSDLGSISETNKNLQEEPSVKLAPVEWPDPSVKKEIPVFPISPGATIGSKDSTDDGGDIVFEIPKSGTLSQAMEDAGLDPYSDDMLQVENDPQNRVVLESHADTEAMRARAELDQEKSPSMEKQSVFQKAMAFGKNVWPGDRFGFRRHK